MDKLTSFKVLSFDVYGTLIHYERGLLNSLQPALDQSNKSNMDQKHILQIAQKIMADEQFANPRQRYSDLLTAVHPKLCSKLGLKAPSEEESIAFGKSVPTWPAFSDTVDALKRLKKHYKMVVLSNVDNASFIGNNDAATGLQGFEWDAVFTAEDIGSYKPDLRNFEYMLREVKDRFGVEKGEVLQTAQSQFHDHHAVREIGIKGAWIVRSEAILGDRDDPVWDWKFDTLEEMADAVEGEVAEDTSK